MFFKVATNVLILKRSRENEKILIPLDSARGLPLSSGDLTGGELPTAN
ncbi:MULTISPECIES: hypothetical protein [Okeania]|nr:MULTISPECIES: hypothetical protein [Okeania]NEP45951.1 hypothetical protein [Okeania sp. SIO2H7]NET11850.1 hypothetical protein [Okeania sp. SIO1H6]NET18201.1 hypothetical protein [Okeania sp. SIO1H5]NEP72724.1 hypothetical protein [Okeania sp. SIO2G5]NEP93358.1 hypothetical protein [Okeania sp. SIO2F5]